MLYITVSKWLLNMNFLTWYDAGNFISFLFSTTSLVCMALKNEEILETALPILLLTWEMHEFTWDVSMTQFDVAGVIKKKNIHNFNSKKGGVQLLR